MVSTLVNSVLVKSTTKYGEAGITYEQNVHRLTGYMASLDQRMQTSAKHGHFKEWYDVKF